MNVANEFGVQLETCHIGRTKYCRNRLSLLTFVYLDIVGEEGVAHGITQTDASVVIVSQVLLYIKDILYIEAGFRIRIQIRIHPLKTNRT